MKTIIAALMLITTCSCGVPDSPIEEVWNDEKAINAITAVLRDARRDELSPLSIMDDIVKAINNKNAEDFKSLFSENLQNSDDIDEVIELIIKAFPGEIFSHEGKSRAGIEKVNDGNRRAQCEVICTAYTENDEYTIYFICERYNRLNPEEQGIQMISVTKNKVRVVEFESEDGVIF